MKETTKSSIAVIGSGFVGGSLAQVFAEKGYDVFNYDKLGKCAPGCIKHNNDGVEITSIEMLMNACESNKKFTGIYFLCLPTPMNKDGSAHLGIIENVLEQLANMQGERIAVIKSTIPPGSTEDLNKRFEKSGLRVCHSPEFLRESSALEDMRNQDRIIIGGPKKSCEKVKQVFQHAFPDVKIVKTSSTNSEMCKYVVNCFLAMKISFANEIYQIVEKLQDENRDCDYDRIIECAMLDKRLGTSHWKVPSFEVSEKTGKYLYGFAKVCFPKDLLSLKFVADRLGVDPQMLSATWNKNLEVRPEQDWLDLKGRAVVDE